MSANDIQVGGTHYKSSIQHWDMVGVCMGGRYLEGCVSKYLYRWRKKNGLQDLEKAKHYLSKLIELAADGVVGGSMSTVDADVMNAFLAGGGLHGTVEAHIITGLSTWRDVELLRQLQACLTDFVAEERARVASVPVPRPTRDQWGLELAMVTAKRGTCPRRKVGCVLTDRRGHVLATGYNGRAAGLAHCNEGGSCPGATAPSGTGLDSCEAIHAEQNALLQCRDVHAIDVVYTTASPCITCVKLLLNTSAQRIVFLEEYPHPEARHLWETAGRMWVKATT